MLDKWKMKLKNELVSNIIWSFLAKAFCNGFLFYCGCILCQVSGN